MADAAAKQQLLVNSIANGVAQTLAPEFGKLAELAAKQSITINAVLARLELLEAAVGSGAAAPKRAVRAGPAKAGAAKAGAAKGGAKKGAGQDLSKIANALLYFRYILATDNSGARETYGTDENVAAVAGDASVAKQDVERDPEAYWSAVGAAIWKTCLTESQKEEIREAHKTWKADLSRNGDSLNEENATE